MPVKKLSDKGSQPRNREMKGKPIGWPKVVSNFKWVLPSMPKGYPMRNPRILRLISTNKHTFSPTPASGECEEKEILECEEEYANRFNPPTPSPGICDDPPTLLSNIVYDVTLDQFVRRNAMCEEGGILRAGSDGGVFRSGKISYNVITPETPECPESFITGPDAIDEIFALYADIYFVDKIHVNTVDAVKSLILPDYEVTSEKGLYGPKVLNIVFIEDVGGSDWQEAYGWYKSQREPVDRWAKYTTYFNVDFAAEYYRLSQIPAIDHTDAISSGMRQNIAIKPDVDVPDFFVGPLLYSKSYVECANNKYSAELEYVVDYYKKVIDDWFNQP